MDKALTKLDVFSNTISNTTVFVVYKALKINYLCLWCFTKKISIKI